MDKTLEIAGELVKVDQLRQMLGPDDADLELRLGTLEGESNVFEVMDEIVHTILADEILEEQARSRARAFEERAKRRRALVMQVMEHSGLRRAQRPLYTISVVDGPKSVHITEEDLLPMHLMRMSPDKTAIGKLLKDGTEVPGAQLNNGPPVLRIVR